MAGRFMSVPMTLSDLERPEVRNQFLGRILMMLIRSATSLHLYKCVAWSVSDSRVCCKTTVLWLLNPFSSVTLTLLIIEELLIWPQVAVDTRNSTN